MLKNLQSKLSIHRYVLKNLQSKLLTLLILSTILPVSVIGIYSISSSTEALTTLKIKQIENEVAQEAWKIEQSLANVYKDVLLLSKIPPVQQMGHIQQAKTQKVAGTSLPDRGDWDWIVQTETIFKAMMDSKPQYQSIRYLDKQGNEIVCLDTETGTGTIKVCPKLTNQAKASFFQPTSKTLTGDVYISPIVLIESGNRGQSPKPAIYYAVPIYNQAKKLGGMVVITVYLEAFISRLEINNERPDEITILATKDGKYLLHPDPDRLWINSNKKTRTLRDDYPSLIADQILNRNQGSIKIDSEQIVSFKAINLGLQNHTSVVYDLPQYTVLQSVSQLKQISLIITLVSLGIAIAVGSTIIRKISKNQTNLYQQAQAALTTAEEKARELEQTLKELHHTQTQLVQTEKMSSLGQLVAGVAHEINNPVSFIYGNLAHVNEYSNDLLHLIRLYQQQYPQPSPKIQTETEAIDLDFLMNDLPKTLDSMRVGADRIRQIVLSLRNFSRIDEAEMKAVNIHDGIDSTLLILQNRTKAHGNFPGVEVVKHYGDLPAVECYAGQLNQVFMNILSNAIDALEESFQFSVPSSQLKDGQTSDPNSQNLKLDSASSPQAKTQPLPTITITTEYPQTEHLTPAACHQPSFVRIRIANNGKAIPPQLRDRLFEPFFTTKPVGKGTGLGLSISYQIVSERHGGKLECHSHPNFGTEFWIEVPLRQGANSSQI